jgi:hypothetical protein
MIFKNKKIFILLLSIIFIIGSYLIYDEIKINNQIAINKVQTENRQKNIDLKNKTDKIVSNYKDETGEKKKEIDKELSDLDKYRLLIEDTKVNDNVIEILLKNVASENINHVKIGINFKDEKGNIIQSDNIIDDNIIKPNSEQTLNKKISNSIKYKTVETEVIEVK